MNKDKLKEDVRNGFISVDSKEFFEKKVKEGIEQHKMNFREFKLLNPDKDFNAWKNENVARINENASTKEELMAIGIFLIALDQFQPIE